MTNTVATERLRTTPRGAGPNRRSRYRLYAVGALLGIVAAAATVAACRSMAGMPGLPMAGGWMLSTRWLPVCGRTWMETAVAFLGMWAPMMAAMMAPVLLPRLARDWETVGLAGARRAAWTATVAGVYLLAWSALGIVVFAGGAGLAAACMHWPALARSVPALAALLLACVGLLQRSAWKRRCLAACRRAPACVPAATFAGAARHGGCIARHCIVCCAGPTVALLVLGVMDLGAMAVVTAAIVLERLAPDGERFARRSGVLGIVAGAVLLLRILG